MRKCVVILLNGEPPTDEIHAENAYVICCDGAYRWAKGRVRIDETLGDFDSLETPPEPKPAFIYPAEKNETDGELAVDRAIALGATDLVFYGGGGGREDHFLGNLHLMYKAKKAGLLRLTFHTNRAEIALCGAGEHEFSCRAGQTVSLLPFGGDAHIMDSSGLKYPMKDLWLRYGSTRGVSNVARGEALSFRVERGYALVFLNKEEA